MPDLRALPLCLPMLLLMDAVRQPSRVLQANSVSNGCAVTYNKYRQQTFACITHNSRSNNWFCQTTCNTMRSALATHASHHCGTPLIQRRRLLSTTCSRNKQHHKVIRATAATPSPAPPLAVKICGITNADDATLAASAGATFVGLIAWPKAKRGVPVDAARDIAQAARQHGATPIAVFVDESAAQIAEYCSAAGIDHAQLHGDAARAQLPDLPAWLHVVYVAHAAADGQLQTVAPRDCCAGGEGISRNRWVCLHSDVDHIGDCFFTVPMACLCTGFQSGCLWMACRGALGKRLTGRACTCRRGGRRRGGCWLVGCVLKMWARRCGRCGQGVWMCRAGCVGRMGFARMRRWCTSLLPTPVLLDLL